MQTRTDDIATSSRSTSSRTALPGTPENPLHKVITIPNLITFVRLILTISFVFLYPIENLRALAITIFILAASTDWFDGQVARRMHQVSYFGKRFDPIMDRFLIFSGILALVITRKLPVWMFAFLLLRDLYLLAGMEVLRFKKGKTVDVVFVGKACTFVLLTGFALLLLNLLVIPGLGIINGEWLPGFSSQYVSFGIWVVYVGCILSLIAASVYTVRAIRILKGEE